MKMDIRKIAKIAGIMIATGVGICAVALVGGAKPSISITNGEVVLSNPFTDEVSVSTGIVMEDKNISQLNSTRSNKFIDLEETLDAFQNLEIEVDTMDVNILSGDEYKIEVSYREGTRFDYEWRGKDLIIEQEDHSYRNNGGGSNVHKGFVNIYIPAHERMKDVEIDMGMGSNVIENVNLGNLELACGMGSVDLRNVTMNTGYLDGGMGSIKGREVVSNGLEINMGMGSVDIQGDLKGTIDIEGGMGELKLETTGKETDYNYDIHKGMGTIHLNGDRQGILEDLKIDNKAENNIIIEGGMGSISVRTQ